MGSHKSNDSKGNFSHECPVCKSGCSKRGMVASQQLEQLVKGYKLCLRSFGLAPVVHDEGVGTTQIGDEISFSFDDDDHAAVDDDSSTH